jgi:hypothetical protein
MEECWPVGKPPTKEAADLKKSKTFRLSTLRYQSFFSENSNVPTSEGKVLMETYFKTFTVIRVL